MALGKKNNRLDVDGYSYVIPRMAASLCHDGVIIRKDDRGCIVEQGNHVPRGFCNHFFVFFVVNATARANGGKDGEKGEVDDKMHDCGSFFVKARDLIYVMSLEWCKDVIEMESKALGDGRERKSEEGYSSLFIFELEVIIFQGNKDRVGC